MDERKEGRPTAYVLGEMTAEERAAFEAELAGSEALRAEVEEIREMAALLGEELKGERESLPAEMRGKIEAAAKGAVSKEAVGSGAVSKEAVSKGAVATGVVVPLKRPWFRRASVWLAAAAVVTLAPAAMWMSAGMRSDERTASAPAASWAPTGRPVATATAAVMAAAEPMATGMLGPVDAPMLGSKAKNGDGQGRSSAVAQKPRDGLRGDVESPGNKFDAITENPFKKPTTDPLSTFSIDVDTASYALVRTYLERGSLPPAGAVRIEEMVNYFSYAYPEPEGDAPFQVQLDLGVAPWAPDHRLARVALRGKTVQMSQMDGVNLVFLVDTSGSMSAENKLPLLKKGLRMLVDSLRPNDTIAIVAYAGSAGLVLPATAARDKGAVLGALDRLSSGGSTNGGAGIELAYSVAAQSFKRGGVNRVILATDGDFNVGTTSQSALVDLIQAKAKTGVFLSVLGFGMGNFNDALLEKIADKGNGQYAYIDSEVEAKRALVDGLGGLVTIAKDVKLQVEFNPAEVAGYRLIGYENRAMAAQDFNNDKKDAGELGSGHTVTALYEIIPVGGAIPGGDDGLKYQAPATAPGTQGGSQSGTRGEVLTVKLRYKEPDGEQSKLLEEVLKSRDVSLSTMSADFKFAAAVASFGMLLRGSKFAGSASYASVLALAQDGAGDDAKRQEMLALVRKAQAAGRP